MLACRLVKCTQAIPWSAQGLVGRTQAVPWPAKGPVAANSLHINSLHNNSFVSVCRHKWSFQETSTVHFHSFFPLSRCSSERANRSWPPTLFLFPFPSLLPYSQ